MRLRRPTQVVMSTLLGVWVLAASACGGSKDTNGDSARREAEEPAPQVATEPPELNVVSVVGALRSIFHEHLTQGLVSLADLLPDERVYGLGALSGLRGEITILGGRAYLAYPVGEDSSRTVVEERPKELATLLVYARVGSWQKTTVREEIGWDALDGRIRSLAEAVGLDPQEPFPFLVEGRVRELAWHVIDGARLGEGEGTMADHLRAAVRHELDEAEVRLIGFYSERHEGVFTHKGSKTHVHCTLRDPTASGHVDHVVLSPGTTIYYPE